MYYLGIDFGIKKVGIALSDADGLIAFPHDIWENDDTLVERVGTFTVEHAVAAIVVGDTRTADGRENEVTKELTAFVAALRARVAMPLHVVPEYSTTLVARTASFEGNARGDVQTPRSKSSANDAHAAALILQRFLDAPHA